MGRPAKTEMAKLTPQTAPVAEPSDVQHTVVSREVIANSAVKSPTPSNRKQQQRPRSADAGGTGLVDHPKGSVAESELRNSSEFEEKVATLPQVCMESVDVGRVQNRRDAQLSPAEETFLTTIQSSKVFTKGSLIRHAAQIALPGVACEFGVYKGSSLTQIRNFRKPLVYGFDSWEGLPDAWDHGQGEPHLKGHFSCEPPVDLPTGVCLIKGWFCDTIPEWLSENPDDIQLLHIDCDLYTSTKDVLTLLDTRIKPGCIILFDELCNFDNTYPNWRIGEWKALLEWVIKFKRSIKPIGRTDHQQVAFVVEV